MNAIPTNEFKIPSLYLFINKQGSAAFTAEPCLFRLYIATVSSSIAISPIDVLLSPDHVCI